MRFFATPSPRGAASRPTAARHAGASPGKSSGADTIAIAFDRLLAEGYIETCPAIVTLVAEGCRI